VCYNHTTEKEVTASVIAPRKFCARPQYSRSGVASQQILSWASTSHRQKNGKQLKEERKRKIEEERERECYSVICTLPQNMQHNKIYGDTGNWKF